jgi:hypothetical protein
MEALGDFHDLFSGGATPAFDSSDPLDSFWAGLDANDLPQPAPQDNRASVEPQALQQHTTEEGQGETEGEAEEEEAEDTMASPVYSCCMNGMAPLSHLRIRYATLWSGRLS